MILWVLIYIYISFSTPPSSANSSNRYKSPVKLAPPLQSITKLSTIPFTKVSHNEEIEKQLILSHPTDHLQSFSTAVFKPGQVAPKHSHRDMFETFFVLSGSGVFTINGVAQTVELYDTITLKPGDTHEVENPIDNRVDLRVLYFGVV